MTPNLSSAPHGEAVRANLCERQLRRYHPRFQGAMRVLATRDTAIGDLAASFPALLFALAVPGPWLDPAPAIERVIAGLPLTEVAAAAGLPMWLRKLPPEAFTCPFSKPPSGDLFRRQIVNHLPRSPKLAPIWLRVVTDFAAVAHEPAAVWIARELVREPGRVKPDRLRLIGLWAWFSSQPATLGRALIDKPWTPDTSIGQATKAANAWRETIALHLDLGPEPITDMWLHPARVDGYDFVPLRSSDEIAEEASAMKNCLRTYGAVLAHNNARLWSVRRDGGRVATLKVACRYGDPLLNIAELKGPGNFRASPELWWAARQWLHMHDLPGIDSKRRDWGTVTLDRATWLSLWRPYWLAKRHIPEWLPIAPSRDALDMM